MGIVNVLNLEKIQEEQKAWVAHNFAGRHSHQPYLGIIEELNELLDVSRTGPEAEIIDAVGDTMIYLLDYCSVHDWPVSTVMKVSAHAVPSDSYPSSWVDAALRQCARVAHYQLKHEQGIRGMDGKVAFAQAAQPLVASIVNCLNRYCNSVGLDLNHAVTVTWESVSQRDWKRNPTTGVA